MSPVAPWHRSCRLREDVRSGTLGLGEFAADLQSVRTGSAPSVYREPREFFPRTYATHNLKLLVRDVLLQLAGRDGRPVLRVQVAYGGGKTHALLALLHLAEHGSELDADPTVHEFVSFAGLQAAPRARVALLPFDQFDLHEGLLVFSPDGRAQRNVRTPWGALAYQLGGDAALARVAQHEADYTSPAEPVLAELLALPTAQGLATLVLIDEALWYARETVQQEPRHLGVLQDFFQVLTQAVARRRGTALVGTLVASQAVAHDPTGLAVMQALEIIFGRVSETADPVVRQDIPEILRRRLFEAVASEPARRAATDAFFARLQQLPVREGQRSQASYERMLQSFPFHADLVEVLYEKWAQLPGFQRTRGALRLMALGLRASEGRDPAEWIGPGVLLGADGGLSAAVSELVPFTGERLDWMSVLTGELSRAVELQAGLPTLRRREVEQAVLATFLHSQPAGHAATPQELWALLCHAELDPAAMEEGLRLWRRQSGWLADDTGVWRLATAPNLTAMHQQAMERVPPSEVDADLRDRVGKAPTLVEVDTGVQSHVLPAGPEDVQDTPLLHLLVLGPECATTPGAEAPRTVARFWAEVSPGNGRTYKNALVALAPEPGRLAAVRELVLRVSGWRRLQESEEFRRVASEAQKRQAREAAAEDERQLRDAVPACFTAVLALDEGGTLRVRVLPAGQGAPFVRVKALLQDEERLVVGQVDPAELLPGSGMGLWKDEPAKRVPEFATPFYQFSRLPRLLRPEVITESVRAGVRDGVFCLRLPRPDGTAELLWRTEPNDAHLQRADAEVVPLQHATLEHVRPELLGPGGLRAPWSGDNGPTVGAVAAFFDGTHAPRLASREVLQRALQTAVRESLIGLRLGERTYVAEEPPAEACGDEAVLVLAPAPVRVEELLPDHLPAAWAAEGTATVAAVAAALGKARQGTVPWVLLQRAVGLALDAGTLRLEPGSGPFPCAQDAAGAVQLGLPVVSVLAAADLIGSASQAAWHGGDAVLGELVRVLEGNRRRIPPAAALQAVKDAIAQGLVRVADGVRVPAAPGPETPRLRLRRPEDARAVDGALTPRQLQDLARLWEELQRAAPGVRFELSCTLIMRGEMPPEVKDGLAGVLRRVRSEWPNWHS